jgi:putative ABC transport system ATP-binding protein
MSEVEARARAEAPPAGTDVAAVRAADLWRVFQRGEVAVEALRGVSLRIALGEFVAIVGPSGSGKSTFMNILGCLDRPTRGSLEVMGRDVAAMTADELAEIRNLDIGFVFQAFNLIPRMSALENVELPLFYGNAPSGAQRVLARSALAAVGLDHRGDHPPSQLSGGEQQRVAIARALVNSPRILVADEPTGNLDRKTGLEIMGILESLHRQQQLTIILVTHDSSVAERADRIVSFLDGRIEGDVRTPGAGRRSGAPAPIPLAERRTG